MARWKCITMIQLNHNRIVPEEPLLLNVAMKLDPTRTTTLRKNFIVEMERRINNIKKLITYSIVDNDCFGLSRPQQTNFQFNAKMTPAGQGQFAFPRDKAKIEGFMRWLREQQQRENGPLEVIIRPGTITGIESPWTDTFILPAYSQGIKRSRQELHKQSKDIPLIGNDAEIAAMIRGPVHANTVGVVFTRTFTGLVGITAEMDMQISRIISEGLINGENPLTIANTLVNGVSNELGYKAVGTYTKAIQRARALARTEVIRAHHLANIAEYEQWGAIGVNVEAEWGLGSEPCTHCQRMAAQGPYTLKEIKSKIPLHPNCVCVAIPVLTN